MVSVPLHFTLLLCSTVFLHPSQILSATQSQPLILPLKAAQIPSPLNELPFHHNVSLTVSLLVGSPPQRVTMVLDTGSQLSWLHCTPTVPSPSVSISTFNPNLSTSYRPIPCSSPTCTHPTPDFTVPVSCDAATDLCHTVLSYADATVVEGNLAAENFVLSGSGSNSNRIVFGCVRSGSSSNPEEDAKSAGLIGMNRGPLSFISQSGYPKFSYCISGQDASGVLLIGGGVADPPLNYTPLIQIPTPLPNFDRIAYTVRLEGIRVGETDLGLPESAFQPDHTGAGQTMLDSGTQFSFLLGPVYSALKAEFLKQTAGVLEPLEDPNFVFQGGMDLCFKSGNGITGNLPSVRVILAGAEIRVWGNELMQRIGEVECVTFGNAELVGLEAFVIGHHHQRNKWVEYDLEKERVGIAEFNCEAKSRRMGLAN